MAETTEFRASDGTVLRVEVDGPPPPLGADAHEPVSRRRSATAETATGTLREAVDRVRPAAQDVLDSLRAMPQAPDRVTLEFGVKLAADAGVVLARASSEAHFKVLMEWEREPRERERGPDEEDDGAPAPETASGDDER
ncbi:CU044_2847 family protein [Streptomyces sp. NPDC058766]|uniref:CU044_2847 family protein n=1 Tax=Streptomyces sp. NPDC058766 TaxID=3346630 RepID=UPI0036C4826B